MRLERSLFVESDLEAVADYIAADSPLQALSFIREIRAQFDKIARAPMLYRLRPEIGADARLVAYGNYVILFRILGEVVRIERIAHGSRNLVAVYSRD